MDLKTWRKNNRVTQSALADQLGVTILTVSRWETGARQPDFATMRKINTITEGQVTPNDLVGVEEYPCAPI